MRIHLDLTTVPPSPELQDTDDFTGLKLVVGRASHAYVHPATLRDLAGDAAGRSEWIQQLEAMLAFASERDWIRSDGAVRMHVEFEDSPSSHT